MFSMWTHNLEVWRTEAYLASKVIGTARHKLLLLFKTRSHLYLTWSRTYPSLTCHSLNLHRCLLSWQVLCPLDHWVHPTIFLFQFSAPVQWCSVVEDEQGTFSGLLLIRPFFFWALGGYQHHLDLVAELLMWKVSDWNVRDKWVQISEVSCLQLIWVVYEEKLWWETQLLRQLMVYKKLLFCCLNIVILRWVFFT